MPMTMAGTAMPAMRVMPTGAPIRVPSCHKIFFFRLQGFFPQNVQPEGLRIENRRNGCGYNKHSQRPANFPADWQVSVPEVVQVRDLLHAEPAELAAADSAGHVVAAPVVHLDDVSAAARTGLDVISWGKRKVIWSILINERLKWLT